MENTDELNGFSMLKLSRFDSIEKCQEIDTNRQLSDIIKQSKKQAKKDFCYYCGKEVKSFCNSHTLPQFCLKSIAVNGKVLPLNSILKLQFMSEEKGIRNSGTFNIICNDCDSKIFKDYENPNKYNTEPTVKMLAEISMKNSLKNIYRADMVIEMIRQNFEMMQIDGFDRSDFKKVYKMDLNDFVEDFKYAKHSSLKPFITDYHIGYHKIIPYVVPLAFQGSITMICDLEGKLINDVYNEDPKYKVRNLDVCIFPLEDKTSIFMFVRKKNTRYKQFFKQLNKLSSLEDQLAVINYMIFSYSEDAFISPACPQDLIMKLQPLAEKNLVLKSKLNTHLLSSKAKCQFAKKHYDFSDYKIYPNLLSEEYAIRK